MADIAAPPSAAPTSDCAAMANESSSSAVNSYDVSAATGEESGR
jgi:hypothetical protein